MVVNSLTLSRRHDPKRRKLGFALSVDGDNAFRCLLTKCNVPSRKSGPGCGVVPWTPEHWDEVRISSRKTSEKG